MGGEEGVHGMRKGWWAGGTGDTRDGWCGRSRGDQWMISKVDKIGQRMLL